MALTDSLISYWPMDEASGNALDVHGSNPLTEASGTIDSVAGKVGNARDFEWADSETFTIADNADLSAGDVDFTFTCWVYSELLANFPVVANKGWQTAGSTDKEWVIYYDTSLNRFVFSVGHGTSQTSVTANNFGAGASEQWYFIVCYHDATNNVIGISINAGTPNTTSHSAGVNDGTGAFFIGGSVPQSLYWDGLIDEVGFWKRVLTADERTALYNGGNGLAYGDFVESSDAPAGFLGGGYGGLIIGA